MNFNSKREDETERASEALEELRIELSQGRRTGLKRRLLKQLEVLEGIRDEARECIQALNVPEADRAAELVEHRQEARRLREQLASVSAELESLSGRLRASDEVNNRLEAKLEKTREFIRLSRGSAGLLGYDEFMGLNQPKRRKKS